MLTILAMTRGGPKVVYRKPCSRHKADEQRDKLRRRLRGAYVGSMYGGLVEGGKRLPTE